MTGLNPQLPPGIPLVVKASCDERIKRIRFPPDLISLQFKTFQQKIAKSLQFDNVDFFITWEDDDGENCEIATTEDLQEALFYFCPSQVDSALEALSMRVFVRVDAKVSLSDYGSSVWGGSDDEGTIASSSSKSAYSKHSTQRRTRRDGAPSSLRSSESSGAYDTPVYSAQRSNGGGSETRSLASSRHGPSPLSRPWRDDSCSRWVGDTNVDLNGSTLSGTNYNDALTSLHGLSLNNSEGTEDWASSEAESETSGYTRGPGARRRARKRSPVALEDGTSIHQGVQCRSCHMSPIVGLRYHCASCPHGADFCADCERTGYAIRAEIGHSASHLILRLAAPLDTSQAVDALSAVLGQAQRRLMEQMAVSSSRNIVRQPSVVQTTRTTVYSNQAVKCSFCISPILQGPRFLCANCPIMSPTSLEGFNLCSSCEEHSLQCHDSSHFFLKITPLPREMDNRSRIPLGERWEVREIVKGGPLLPMLYAEVEQQDPLQPSPARNTPIGTNLSIRMGDGMVVGGDATSNDVGLLSRGFKRGGIEAKRRAQEIEMSALRESQSRYLVPLDRLVHPSIICDNCFSVIQGVWYRCCHCTTSFDLCDMCESKISHDPSHSFAVFKQPVDLDLFKSCVDHQDAGEGLIGASRPMLAFPLL